MNNNTHSAILVGCGGMSSVWLTAAQSLPNLTISALVDLRVESARAQAAAFGLTDAHVTDSLDDAIAKVRPDIVFDCTVPAVHKKVTLTALAAGCHVLGEKPIADNLTDAREMVQAAADHDRIYAVIQNRRYARAIRSVRDALASGAIGRPHTINADFYLGPRFDGFRAEMEHVLLVDMAIHSFDQARFITDADPVSVYCHEFNPASSWYRHGASAMAIFELTNDLVFNYRGSWCAEGLSTTWECAWRIVGEAGTLLWDGGDSIQIERISGSDEAAPAFFRATKSITPEPATWNPEDDGHAGLMREFLTCIENGTQPMTQAADNIRSLEMVFGAVESAETERKIRLL